MSATTFHAHFLRDLDEQSATALAALLDHGRVRLSTGSEIPSDQKVDMLIAGRPSEEHVRSCGESLRYLVIPWAGLPERTRELALRRPDLRVHNLHHNAVATAEMAVTLLLSAAKVVVPLDQSLRTGDWSPRYRKDNDTRLLYGQTALILGYGSIGERVARMLRAFDMQVLAVRRSISGKETDELGVEVHGAASLHDLLPRANFLVLCVPLTDETRGLIGERELALLPADAVLSNVAHGVVIDERALFEALRSRRLHAAGLDVWYQYPADEESRSSTFPSEYPIHELDNVVMSPHRGGAVGVEESEQMRWQSLAEVVNAAARRFRGPESSRSGAGLLN